MVMVNTALRIGVAMTLGAQTVVNVTTMLIQGTPMTILSDFDDSYTISASDGFQLTTVTQFYPECPTLSFLDYEPLSLDTNLRCQLWNSTKMLKALPATCKVNPMDIEMGSTYFLKTNYIVSSFQPAIVLNISLNTVYEMPTCSISNQTLLYFK